MATVVEWDDGLDEAVPSPAFESSPMVLAGIVGMVVIVSCTCLGKWVCERNQASARFVLPALGEPARCSPADSYYNHHLAEVKRRRYKTRRWRVAVLSLSFLSLVMAMVLINAKKNFHIGLMLERLDEVSRGAAAVAVAVAVAAAAGCA